MFCCIKLSFSNIDVSAKCSLPSDNWEISFSIIQCNKSSNAIATITFVRM